MSKENVVLLITSAGEHILGTIASEDETGVVLENPVSMVPDPHNRGRMMFMPYLQFTKLTQAHFPNHDTRHILTDVKDDLAGAYDQQFGAGIVTPNQEIILG
jgi:hypothetical protein